MIQSIYGTTSQETKLRLNNDLSELQAAESERQTLYKSGTEAEIRAFEAVADVEGSVAAIQKRRAALASGTK